MRISVSLVVNMVVNDMSREEIIDQYPYLEDEDITQALKYAAWASDDRGLMPRRCSYALPGRYGHFS